jgi:hypothetical protein
MSVFGAVRSIGCFRINYWQRFSYKEFEICLNEQINLAILNLDDDCGALESEREMYVKRFNIIMKAIENASKVYL